MYTLRLAKHQPDYSVCTGKLAYKVDLPLQMAECEANYYRLLKLVGTLEQDEYRFVIHRARNESLQILRIIERSRYTTTIQLRQIPLVPMTQWLQMPRLTLRMYHDAQLAEVLAWEGHKRLRPRYDYPNSAMYQSDEKLQINQFLGECLTVCLAQGRVLDEVVPDPAPKI